MICNLFYSEESRTTFAFKTIVIFDENCYEHFEKLDANCTDSQTSSKSPFRGRWRYRLESASRDLLVACQKGLTSASHRFVKCTRFPTHLHVTITFRRIKSPDTVAHFSVQAQA